MQSNQTKHQTTCFFDEALKNTHSRALLEYDNREKENRLSENERDHFTRDHGNRHGCNRWWVEWWWWDTVTGLKELFSQLLIDHENKIHKNSVKGGRGAKDGKGASIKNQIPKSTESPNHLSKNQRRKQAAKRKKQQSLDAAGSDSAKAKRRKKTKKNLNSKK